MKCTVACLTDHTRTSLLRTLNTGEQGEWLLPETKEVLERQWQRQKDDDNGNCNVLVMLTT